MRQLWKYKPRTLWFGLVRKFVIVGDNEVDPWKMVESKGSENGQAF